jgi:hypothetical protein
MGGCHSLDSIDGHRIDLIAAGTGGKPEPR